MADRQEDKKVQLELTSDQRKQLATVFGEDIVKRLESIDVEQIAGFLKTNALVN